MKCRHCATSLDISFANLGSAPPSNNYLSEGQLRSVEKWYPLKVMVCSQCWLGQTQDYTQREEIFSPEYAYFSSFSETWLEHCKKYVLEMIERFNLNEKSLVGEIAANDGYLLQFFQEKNIPCFGVEPTASTANAARKKNLTIFTEFFGKQFAQQLKEKNYLSDLLIANNVLAHVPDINDFVSGFHALLKADGVATFEFPHFYQLVIQSQFDTIYHEHFSYLSLLSVKRIFDHHGLNIFDVEQLQTHGGSLRVFVQKKETGKQSINQRVADLLSLEKEAGMEKTFFYQQFQEKMLEIKRQFLLFLLEIQARNEKIVAYGAAAKGNTLLNFAGVRSDLLSYVIDKNPAKQNKFLPGSQIPIKPESQLHIDKPKWILILPWNIKDEIMQQLSYVREWGAKFVIAIPTLTVYE